MRILIILACLACTSQLLFQVVLLSEGAYLYGHQLQACKLALQVLWGGGTFSQVHHGRGRGRGRDRILIILACLVCTSQLLFQVVLLSEGAYLYGHQLQACKLTL